MQKATSSDMEHPAAGGTDRVSGNSEDSRMVSTSLSRRLMISFALLSLLGAAVGIELTRIHVFVHTDPSYHSICAMSEGVNCETVAVSPYSVFAGLPVSVWGITGYLLMGCLAFWSVSRKSLHPTWPVGLLLILTTFSIATSAVLAFISATRINSFCLFCMGSYAINTGLFLVTLIAGRQTRAPVWNLVLSDLKALIVRPVVFVAAVLVVIVTLGSLLVFVPSYWRTPGWTDLPKLASGTDESGHHWIGARNPKLTIVEFSDYECPHCRAAHKAMRVLAAKHPEHVRLVHRHLPLDMACHPGLSRPFHARACLFAEAAECAGLQGRFWEMNDAIFSLQETVKTENVDPVELAVRLGLNRSDFKRCLESHATHERIAVDVRESLSRKLQGTPSFIVGGRLFLGRIPEAELDQLLVATP